MRLPRSLRRLVGPGRIRVSWTGDSGGGLPLPLPQRRAWIAGLTVGVIGVVAGVITLDQLGRLVPRSVDTVVDVALLVLLAFWVLALGLATVALFLTALFLLFVAESARIDLTHLIHVVRVGPLRVVIDYDLTRVRDLRVVDRGKDGARIQFDYDGTDAWLGSAMPTPRAEERVRMIKSAMDAQGVRRASQGVAAPGRATPPPPAR